MALQLSGAINISQLNTEFGRSASAAATLRGFAIGSYGALNTYNPAAMITAIQTTPYSLSDWYGYNHNLIGGSTDAAVLGLTIEGHNFTNLVTFKATLTRDFVWTNRSSTYPVSLYGWRYRIGADSWTYLSFPWDGGGWTGDIAGAPYSRPEVISSGGNYSISYIIGTLTCGQYYEYQFFLYCGSASLYFYGASQYFTVGAANSPYIEHGSYYGDHRLTWSKIWVSLITNNSARLNTLVVSAGNPGSSFTWYTRLYNNAKVLLDESPGQTDTIIDAPPLYATNWTSLSPSTTYYWAVRVVCGANTFTFGPYDAATWEHYKFTTTA